MKSLWVSSARIVGNPLAARSAWINPRARTRCTQLFPAQKASQAPAANALLRLSSDFGLLY
jgi:hypothetical protein